VPNFSAIARPLYDLTKKRAPWSWSEDCEVAFRQLQHCLCNAPVLRLPDWDRPFTLTTDSSNYAVGAVLSQHFDDGWHPISYFSSSLLDELGHELFEIETLLDRRVRHYKTVTRTTYLVKWRFYDLDEACWEPESSLPVEFIREYDRAHPR